MFETMGATEDFKEIADAVQQEHQSYFDALPEEQSAFNSIHDHFYLFTTASDGVHLRFQTNSELPEEIRNDLQAAFDNYFVAE